MPRIKYSQILFTILIFLAGFVSGQWLYNDKSNATDLADNYSASSLAVSTRSSIKTTHKLELPPTISAPPVHPTPALNNSLTLPLAPAACNQHCMQKLLDDLFEQSTEWSFSEFERYSPFLHKITHRLQQDDALLAEFNHKLMQQLEVPANNSVHKREAMLSIASILAEENRAPLAWKIAQSYQDPNMGRIALDLLPNDSQLHSHIASNAMQKILSDGSPESFALLQHVVNLGGDLSETTVAADLEYLQNTVQDESIRDVSLNLLAQINPHSQAFKVTLTESLNSEPQRILSALHAMERIYRAQAAPDSDHTQSTVSLTPANHERIKSMANDTTTPIEVRIASLQVLMAIDDTASQ